MHILISGQDPLQNSQYHRGPSAFSSRKRLDKYKE